VAQEIAYKRSRGLRTLVAVLVFAVNIAIWIALVAVGVASPDGIPGLWAAVGALPFVLQAAAWLLLLPYMIALWVGQSGWAMWLRMAIVCAIALATVLLTWPRFR
jgi:hypothetical protein